MRLPRRENRIWKQDNLSDLYGDIWSSFGIDLSEDFGKIKTRRMLSVARSVNDGTDNFVSGIGLAVAFRAYKDQYFAATNGTISKTGSSRISAWGLDTTADKPTTVSNRYSDMEVFNDNLYVTLSGTGVSKWNGSAWSSISPTGMISSVSHMLTVFAGRLYIQADYAKIQSINTSDTSAGTIGSAANTIDLGNPTQNSITFIRATSNRIYIGTVNRNGSKGHVYGWDGVSNNVSETYKLESSGAMAGVVKDDTLYIMDNDGRLLHLNGVGGTFVEDDRLPLQAGEYLKGALFSDPSSTYNERWIHPNGMTVKDRSILILVNNEYRGSTPTFEENIPAGVWEWTRETGLYHKYPLSLTNHDTTTIKDYGQNRLSIPGALTYIKSNSTNALDNGSLLAGAQLYYDESNTENHILIDDLVGTYKKSSYFITPRIYSENIEDVWQKLIPRIKVLQNTGDKIIIKHRTSLDVPLEFTITTWSSSNTIKTTTNVTAYAKGDEVEILQGEGAGKNFLVDTISDLGGSVYEIKFTESFEGVSGEGGKARLVKWKEIRSYNGSDDVVEAVFGSSKSWVQLKIIMEWTGDNEIVDMFLLNQAHKINE